MIFVKTWINGRIHFRLPFFWAEYLNFRNHFQMKWFKGIIFSMKLIKTDSWNLLKFYLLNKFYSQCHNKIIISYRNTWILKYLIIKLLNHFYSIDGHLYLMVSIDIYIFGVAFIYILEIMLQKFFCSKVLKLLVKTLHFLRNNGYI